MLHIIEGVRPPGQDRVLRSMFEARKQVFVDLLRWDVPVVDSRFEIDQFDDENAIYLVVSDQEGSHLASARLLPSTRPHILGNLYPELCARSVPRGANIYEITRFCLERRLKAVVRRQARDTLVHAIAKYGVERRISRFTGVAEVGWLQQILAFGWHCQPLGLPQSIDGHVVAAPRIDITPETPNLLSRAGILMDDREIMEMSRAA